MNTVVVNVGVADFPLFTTCLCLLALAPPRHSAAFAGTVAQGWGLCLQSPSLHCAVYFYISPITDLRTRIAHGNGASGATYPGRLPS